ncbi:MAG: hypothetical protein JRJ19_03115 [Deltaproteobacteria bacterium]|nr:hypothetical protein [Deltaproteobacteria bacterium]MBW1871024.1 hypothetical protein [Deltaproteobacteria bacterium]
MYNSNVISISCGGLDFFDSAVDFSDLAFMNMILCMQESDYALKAKMQEIREVNRIKRDLTNKIGILNECLSWSGAKEGDDLVYVDGGLVNPKKPGEGIYKTSEEQRKHEKTQQAARDAYAVVGLDMEKELNECCLYRKSQVESRIEELRAKLEEYNSSSSVMMIDLQRLMNKRNEAVQMTSNIEAKCHQTAMSVIANLK